MFPSPLTHPTTYSTTTYRAAAGREIGMGRPGCLLEHCCPKSSLRPARMRKRGDRRRPQPPCHTRLLPLIGRRPWRERELGTASSGRLGPYSVLLTGASNTDTSRALGRVHAQIPKVPTAAGKTQRHYWERERGSSNLQTEESLAACHGTAWVGMGMGMGVDVGVSTAATYMCNAFVLFLILSHPTHSQTFLFLFSLFLLVVDTGLPPIRPSLVRPPFYALRLSSLVPSAPRHKRAIRGNLLGISAIRTYKTGLSVCLVAPSNFSAYYCGVA
ncbi:hypothetical protein LX32DRAFT_114151 [Colletotrichum zoysiae]|uniref:Uncharacterized protein n=1 Tax=Colletotrichum zoysiae TaxID=1216348 RepID=A0AAD9LX76_9PEZI|nr:hypothetical protein LX32DRAFT_114151 [Colletotrichum zoysiae]